MQIRIKRSPIIFKNTLSDLINKTDIPNLLFPFIIYLIDMSFYILHIQIFFTKFHGKKTEAHMRHPSYLLLTSTFSIK